MIAHALVVLTVTLLVVPFLIVPGFASPSLSKNLGAITLTLVLLGLWVLLIRSPWQE